MKKGLAYIPVGLLISMLIVYASITGNMFTDGVHIDWVVTDSTVTANFDSLEYRNNQLQRLLDSVAGPISRGEVHILGTANFSNATNDSTNLQLSGAVYNSWGLPYDMYLDRFAFRTAEPDSKAPSTFRNDLPRISTDSALVFRMSRNDGFAAGTKAAITAYKISRSTGLSVASTVGVFYDMVRFDEAILPAANTSVQLAVTISLKKNR